MKRMRCVALLVATFGVTALGGCGIVGERHPTTESRYMTPTEQAYWNDRQTREEKSAYWREELDRQSAVRFSRSLDPVNW